MLETFFLLIVGIVAGMFLRKFLVEEAALCSSCSEATYDLPSPSNTCFIRECDCGCNNDHTAEMCECVKCNEKYGPVVGSEEAPGFGKEYGC